MGCVFGFSSFLVGLPLAFFEQECTSVGCSCAFLETLSVFGKVDVPFLSSALLGFFRLVGIIYLLFLDEGNAVCDPGRLLIEPKFFVARSQELVSLDNIPARQRYDLTQVYRAQMHRLRKIFLKMACNCKMQNTSTHQLHSCNRHSTCNDLCPCCGLSRGQRPYNIFQ